MTGSAMPPDVVAAAAAAAKAWLRAADGQDEAAIAALGATALALAEAFCGRALVARPFEEAVAPSETWTALATTPVTAITGVVAVTGAGAGAASAALAPDAYAIDIDAEGVGWLRLTAPSDAERLVVSYAAGAASGWNELPPPVAQGIAMLVAHLFDRRDGDVAPPAAVAALWRPWRRIGLGRERWARDRWTRERAGRDWWAPEWRP